MVRVSISIRVRVRMNGKAFSDGCEGGVIIGGGTVACKRTVGGVVVPLYGGGTSAST